MTHTDLPFGLDATRPTPDSGRMADEHVIAVYQRLARLHHAMLAAARARNWEEFEALGQTCALEVDRVRDLGAMPVQNPQGRQIKIDLLERILEDDRRIREIVLPWMGELERLIRPQRAAVQAYTRHQQASDPSLG